MPQQNTSHMPYKTLISALFVFFLGNLLLAQDNSFTWGVQAYPNYSGRRLVALANYSDEEIQELEALETGMFGYSAGVMAEWRGDKLGMRLGLNYMNAGYQTIRQRLQQDDPNAPSEQQIQYVSNFIEVPVEFLFSHDLKEAKASMFFMLGASFAYNFSNQTRTVEFFGETNRSASVDTEGDFRTFHTAFQSGIGMELGIGERVILLFQPNFQFWLQGLLEDADLNRNLYSVGMKVGAFF